MFMQTSESAIKFKNEVIEELDEHDEEERKTHTQYGKTANIGVAALTSSAGGTDKSHLTANSLHKSLQSIPQ